LKSKLLLAAGLAAAAIATVVVVTANAAPSGGRTFKLVEKDTSFHFTDVAPLAKKGPGGGIPSAGDSFQFGATLWTPAGKRQGNLYVVCVAITGGKAGLAHCTGTFKLPGGTLEGAAVTSFSSDAADHIAIVGGTGAYEGARGTIVSAPTKNGSNDTVHLLP
jgi:hypothetical protein